MRKLSFLLMSLMVTSSQNIALAGSVSFDQLSTSSDLTVSKWNADMDRIYQKVNSNIQTDNIADDTVAETDMADDANPRLRTYEGAACEKVYTGLLPTTTSSTLVGSVPSGTAYPLGYRVVKSSSTPKTWTASKWTFVDIDINGGFTYSEVAIGGSTPSVATNSIRLARVSTDGTQVASVQDLRTTSCATGPFSIIADTVSEASLGDILKNGARTRRFSSAGRTPAGWAQGAFVSYDTATTFKVTSGSLYINGKYRANSQDITVTTGNDSPTTGGSGLDTGTVTGGPQTFYIYGVADQDSTAGYSATYSTNASTPTGITNYRLLGQIKTDITNLFTSNDVVTAHAISERELIGGWISFNGTGTIVSIDAYNVSSLLDTGTGAYTIVWANAFTNAGYALSGFTQDGSAGGVGGYVSVKNGTSPAAGSVQIVVGRSDTGAVEDHSYVAVMAIGDTRK